MAIQLDVRRRSSKTGPGPTLAGAVRAPVAGLSRLVPAQRRGRRGRATWRAGARCASTCPSWCRPGERLVELAGGGDVEARFLSLWCPPPLHRRLLAGRVDRPGGQDEPRCCATTTSRPRCSKALAGHALERPAGRRDGRLHLGRARRQERGRRGGVAVVRRAHRRRARASAFRWCCAMCSSSRRARPRRSRCCSACRSA